MKFSNKTYENIAYGILFVLLFFVILYSFSFKYTVVKHFDFNNHINKNSNTIVEGYKGLDSKANIKNNDIMDMIKNKLSGLTTELGGDQGKKETKEILKNTKKICNIECAKCMMNMIEENKGIRTIDIEKLINNDQSDNCQKCKKYTELSNTIQNMIDNL